MAVLNLAHCERAISDLSEYGDNDVIPFDVDTKFISDNRTELANALLEFGHGLEKKTKSDCRSSLRGLEIFSERLLAPVGSDGFRITTKIHPFWNLYLNSLAVALAELHEPLRSDRTHSYRFSDSGPSIFDKSSSWRGFREASITECDKNNESAVVVQTDISSFYEHVNHHRLENFINDLLPNNSNIAIQIDVLLGKLSAGRSFGLPVGGQASRVFSEILLSSVDRTLEAQGVRWRRYVDDFILIASSRHDAYKALGMLGHALGDFGLSLNRTKTTVLSSKHYIEYVSAQLGTTQGDSGKLKEIDLHFDPYSDAPDDDYNALKQTVQQLDIAKLIALELDKGQPDSFLVRQVSRSLALLEPQNALGLCSTLLDQRNIHAFRANWATIMRGISHVRGHEDHIEIYEKLDELLDSVPKKSPHLITVDTNVLHYLRTIRFKSTGKRAKFLLALYDRTQSCTVKRACIDCWRQWKDRDRFVSLRNNWNSLSVGEQRMLWLAASTFGDDGSNFQKQVRQTLDKSWGLGLQSSGSDPFVEIFTNWVADEPAI